MMVGRLATLDPLLPQVAHTWEVCIRPGVRIVNAAAMPLLVHLAGPSLTPEMPKPSVQELSPMTSKEVRSRSCGNITTAGCHDSACLVLSDVPPAMDAAAAVYVDGYKATTGHVTLIQPLHCLQGTSMADVLVWQAASGQPAGSTQLQIWLGKGSGWSHPLKHDSLHAEVGQLMASALAMHMVGRLVYRCTCTIVLLNGVRRVKALIHAEGPLLCLQQHAALMLYPHSGAQLGAICAAQSIR